LKGGGFGFVRGLFGTALVLQGLKPLLPNKP